MISVPIWNKIFHLALTALPHNTRTTAVLWKKTRIVAQNSS